MVAITKHALIRAVRFKSGQAVINVLYIGTFDSCVLVQSMLPETFEIDGAAECFTGIVTMDEWFQLRKKVKEKTLV